MRDRSRTALTVTAALALAAPLAAQAPEPVRRPDARWQAFLGCWTPEGAADAPRAGGPIACVVPRGTDAVQVITLAPGGDGILRVDGIVADGRRTEVDDDEGCTGWEQGDWSADGRRLYLRGDVTCGAQRRRGSGLLTLLGDGYWLDVRTVRDSAVGTGVIRIARWLPVMHDVRLPDGMTIAPRPLAARRGAAAAPLGAADIVEASRAVDSTVVEAWLTQRGEGIALDGRALRTLVAGKVPARTIDALVALQHADKVAAARPADGIDPAMRALAARRVGGGGGGGGSGGAGGAGSMRLGGVTSLFPWALNANVGVIGGWTAGLGPLAFVSLDGVDLVGPMGRSSWGEVNPLVATWANFNTMLAWPWAGPLYATLTPIFQDRRSDGGSGGTGIGLDRTAGGARPAVINGVGYTGGGTTGGVSAATGGYGGSSGGGMTSSGASSGGTSGTSGGSGRTAMPRP